MPEQGSGMAELRHGGSIPLETERLRLRAFRPDDAEAIYANWASDSEVTKYLSWRAHSRLQITRDVLDSWCRHATICTYRWAITLKPEAFPGAVEDEPVGQIDVVRIHEDGFAEMGWVLSRKYWRQGILTEAGHAVFRYLLETVGFAGICARHDRRNVASGKLMQKLGMQWVESVDSTNSGCTDNTGMPCAVEQYRLSREAYNELQIRPALPEEVPEIGRMYDAVCDAQPKKEHKTDAPGWIRGVYPTVETAREGVARGDLYVALRAGEVIGAVVLNEDEPDAYSNAGWYYPADRALIVHTLAIHPAERGKGTAKALMRFAEELARRQGIPVIRLDTYGRNFPAKRLYEQLGYRRAGDIDLGIEETFGINNFHTYEKKIGE